MTDVKTTILPAGAAKGVNKRTAPMTARHLKDAKPKRKPRAKTEADHNLNMKRIAERETASTKKAAAASKTKRAGTNTFTTVEIAAEQGISAKTLRARIRRNIDAWEPLFKDGTKHVFADNKTTRNKITALLS